MNKINKIKLIFILMIIMLSTGCWNYRELNKMTIVSGIGIDKKDDYFLISIQALNAQNQPGGGSNGNQDSGGGGNPGVAFFQAEGKSIFEGLNNILLNLTNELYIGHVDVVIIGEEIAKEGIYEVIDFLLRDRESRKIFPFIIAKNAKASDVLKILTPIEPLPSINIKSSLEIIAALKGTLSNKLFDRVIRNLYTEGREVSISSIEIIGSVDKGKKSENIATSDPETTLRLNGPAILLKDKLVGYLEGEEAIGYNLIRDKIEKTVISFPCDQNNNYGAIIVDKATTKLKTEIKNNKPVSTIDTYIECSLSSFSCKLDLSKKKNIDKIRKIIDDKIKKMIEKTIFKLQKEFKSDAIGFGEMLYRHHYKDWLKYKDDWNNTFSNMDYKINLKIKIDNIGAITNYSRKE